MPSGALPPFNLSHLCVKTPPAISVQRCTDISDLFCLYSEIEILSDSMSMILFPDY